MMSKKTKLKNTNNGFGGKVSNEAFWLIAITSFSIGFVASLFTWLFTVDYIFVVLKK